MRKDIFFECNKLDLIELDTEQLKKVEGGLPWFLVGILFGAAYYLVAEILE